MSTEGEALEKAVPQETWFDAGQVLEAAYNNGYPLTGEIDADGNVVGEGLFGCDSDGHDCSLRALLYSGGYIPGTRARIATIGHPSTSLILDLMLLPFPTSRKRLHLQNRWVSTFNSINMWKVDKEDSMI